MTNLCAYALTLSEGIVRHSSHHTSDINAGIVQWLYLEKLALLSHVMPMMWVQFPAQEIIFCCTWGNCLLFTDALG